ncbi:MAG: hypothetical protein NUV87_04045 [Candidatus Roizmanbacteria bacterium]|nr:hypothetical protein [Candidatus Roizmanbacteria bacterium]MCR4312936.1 hypothetical protein [Candidatus Roizmanbacteria bacterium]
MIAQENLSRFPHVDKVLDRIQNTKNLAAQIGWTFVAVAVTMWDFPGAFKKAFNDLKGKSKKPPSI